MTRSKLSSRSVLSSNNASVTAVTAVEITPPTTLEINDEILPLVELIKEGDLILDVKFQTSQDCTKSIPKDALRHLRSQNIPFPSPRILYRIKSESLIKESSYFRLLLSPNFAEGIAIQKTCEALAESGQNPINVDAKRLPRTMIIDEDLTTKTVGREQIFADLLRVIHGLDPKTTPFTTQCWTVLVLMADNYDVIPSISRRLQKASLSHTYRVTTDKTGEESLRQKVIIHYYMGQGPNFKCATKDLIMRGSIVMNSTENCSTNLKGAWWDLPHGIEPEIAYRRACVLRTIASVQNQFLDLYSSRELQCKLGYDSSSSCDSFQLGEMIKFLSRKELLFLISFQPTLSEDLDSCKWPDAYIGDINALIGSLRQCPSYQLDQNHKHCGLRTRLLPALDFIQNCIDIGLGITIIPRKVSDKFQSQYSSWRPSSSVPKIAPAWNNSISGKSVDHTISEKIEFGFQFAQAKSNMAWPLGQKEARGLFTAETWNWVTEQDLDDTRLGVAFRVMK
ncbi:putative hydroxyproline-rich glyco protein [Golovinomyces cichoracearum]|uniref:Putative hydroxyproline-rich glyco protein n=1 Tax=Golovinomyces cichoracearum TaxID=62708 RepID=A0A420I705_9PEZI|nr:putative hydroxyproline-rich glyco protein [Golovinomyces cichoracearum]